MEGLKNGLHRVGGVGVKQGTGIREQGTAGCEGLTRGPREQGAGNREQGIGNRDQGNSGPPRLDRVGDGGGVEDVHELIVRWKEEIICKPPAVGPNGAGAP